MSRKTIAPTLSAFVNRKIGNDDDPEVSAAWRAELRALLAVAEAAESVHARYLRQWTRNANRKEEVLGRALARLSRASHGSGKTLAEAVVEMRVTLVRSRAGAEEALDRVVGERIEAQEAASTEASLRRDAMASLSALRERVREAVDDLTWWLDRDVDAFGPSPLRPHPCAPGAVRDRLRALVDDGEGKR